MAYVNEEKVVSFLSERLFNVFGICGLVGNLIAESGLRPNNLQDVHNEIFKMSDEEYTQGVNDGTINEYRFVHDSAGYGLAQWTYYTRKQKLYTYAKHAGVSIGNLDMQLSFLVNELMTDYGALWERLTNAETIREASDAVLTMYEQPANQNETVRKARAAFGEEIYNKYFFCASCNVGGGNMYDRKKVVDLVKSWEGKKEADGSYKSIIDIYNGYKGKLPRGLKMSYSWAWCACTWSALAIKLGYTAIMPIEMSCYYIVEEAKKMGCWHEADGYTPQIGDAVLYDWQDGSNYAVTDNYGTPDHIGTVIEVYPKEKRFVVMEGNYNDAVKRRTMSVNGRYIRGFITPHYDTDTSAQGNINASSGITIESITKVEEKKSVEYIAREVIAGKWGVNEERKKKLTAAGYDYNAVQKAVNNILNVKPVIENATAVIEEAVEKFEASDYAERFEQSVSGEYAPTEEVYMRNGAGKSHKAITVLTTKDRVMCYGFYTEFNGVKWLYVNAVVGGVTYTGFVSSKYLNKKRG